MLEKAFNDVYTKFKLHFYQNVFQRFATREATLTTVESFCMEGIMAMGEPTIAEFSRMMGILHKLKAGGDDEGRAKLTAAGGALLGAMEKQLAPFREEGAASC